MKKILTCFLCILSALVLVNVTPAYASTVGGVCIKLEPLSGEDYSEVTELKYTYDNSLYTFNRISFSNGIAYFTCDSVPYGSDCSWGELIFSYNGNKYSRSIKFSRDAEAYTYTIYLQECSIVEDSSESTEESTESSESGTASSTESTESSESTETTEEPSEVVKPVSVDMTETNSKLDKIHAVLLMILVIILFNVAYEFIKKTIGKGA